jgi:hypothetical protein
VAIFCGVREFLQEEVNTDESSYLNFVLQEAPVIL